MLDCLGLKNNCLSGESLPKSQGGQVGVSIGEGRGQADGGAEGVDGLKWLFAESEDLALIGPQNRVIRLGIGGTANELLGQVEIALLDGLPGLLRQLARPATVFHFLFLGIHAYFSMR